MTQPSQLPDKTLLKTASVARAMASRLSNPLYPRASGGAGAEGLNKGIHHLAWASIPSLIVAWSSLGLICVWVFIVVRLGI